MSIFGRAAWTKAYEPTIEDAELIKHFKQLDQLSEEEKKSILKVVAALIRDYNAKQAYLL